MLSVNSGSLKWKLESGGAGRRGRGTAKITRNYLGWGTKDSLKACSVPNAFTCIISCNPYDSLVECDEQSHFSWGEGGSDTEPARVFVARKQWSGDQS